MLTLVLWSLGLAFMPLVLELAWMLIAGVGRVLGFGAPHEFDEFAEFERRRDLCSQESDLLSRSVAIAGRISPSGCKPHSASRH